MSNATFKRLIFLLAAFAVLTAVVIFSGGCSFQPPAAEQPKEESSIPYPSPYDALTSESDANCDDYLIPNNGEPYVISHDSNTISSYMKPCQMSFMMKQSKEMKACVAALTTSTNQDDPRLAATQMSSEDGHSLIQLRNEKMNVDVFLRTKAPEMLPRSKDFDGSYDRNKLTMPVPDFVDQIAQKLIANGYKFNNAQPGQLQFETGTLEAESGYGTAAIMFDPATK